MKMYEPHCNSFQMPLAASISQVPVPAPETMRAWSPTALSARRVSSTNSAARPMSARRSAASRTCCAEP